MNGFWAEGDLFVPDEGAGPAIVMNPKDRSRRYLIGAVVLVTLCVGTVISTMAILTLQLLWAQAQQFDDASLLRNNGDIVGSLIITAQVVVFNKLYKQLAVYLTDVENQRLENQYEDSLILKVTLFQFCNSYFALFYIAFVKAQGFAIFDSFGAKDRQHRAYTDMCGEVGSESYSLMADGRQLFVKGECMTQLRTLMLSHLVIKPLIENVVQLAIPWAKRKLASWKQQARPPHVHPLPQNPPATPLPLAACVRTRWAQVHQASRRCSRLPLQTRRWPPSPAAAAAARRRGGGPRARSQGEGGVGGEGAGPAREGGCGA